MNRRKKEKITSKQISRKTTPPTISACMIVKNEEALLPQCLESIKSLVNEIIMVDTGSTDQTVEIAKAYGARIYHHLWENDFSKHRNQSISYATGDWIFVIDADEILLSWGKAIAKYLLDKAVDSIYVKVENDYADRECAAWHNSIRIFRNNGIISYRNRVHNELVGQMKSAYSAAVLHHSGYALDRVREDEKFQRTKGLLEEEIMRTPEDPRNHHYLSVSLLGKRLYDPALREAETALRLASNKQGEPLYLWTRFVAAVCCINLGRVDEAERLCLEAVKLQPLHLDSHYLLSTIGYSKGLIELFLENSHKYLSLVRRAKKTPNHFNHMVLNTVDHEWRIHLHRGYAFETLGLTKEAKMEYEVSSRVCPDKLEYHRLFSDLFSTKPKSAETGQLFEKEDIVCSSTGLSPKEVDPNPGLEASQVFETNEVQQGDEETKTVPGLSLCMIVKNEEELLAKCLESVKEQVDEIVIVDTGSTDRTVEIATSYGAKVYSHSWEGDFSKHRNQSIGYATKEWILILDADEVVDKESAGYLREVLKEKKADSLYLIVRSTYDRGRGEAVHNSIRLFRNNGKIRYEGRVHNAIVGEQSSLVCPVTIFHVGYNLPEQKSHQKFLRTTALLKREIEDRPEHPRSYHYLAASYLSEDRYPEALDFSLKAIDLAERYSYSDHLYLWSHFIAGLANLKLGKLAEAENICLRGLAKNSLHLDSHYLLVFIWFNQQQWEKALYHGHEYQRLLEEFKTKPGAFGLIVHNTINHCWRVNAHMGLALEELGDAEGAKKYLSPAIHLCGDQGEYHKLLAGHYLSKSNFPSAEFHFNKAVEYSPDDLELLKGGVELFTKRGKKEKAKEILKRMIELDGSQVESHFRLGTLLFEENALEAAGGHFQCVIAVNPRHTGALINLGLVAKREKRLEEAVSFFKMALREDPFSVEGLSNLGYTLYHRGDLVGADDAFGRLSRIAPALTDPLLLLSKIHVQLGHFDRAVEDCDALLRLLDLDRNVVLHSLANLADLYIGVGRGLTQKGQPETAHWAYDTALLLSENAPDMLNKILSAFQEAGNFDGALKYFEKVTNGSLSLPGRSSPAG
jgi:glycosyltransferase involved in cell wall biosynthesis/Flp pilus assembly protein TadD